MDARGWGAGGWVGGPLAEPFQVFFLPKLLERSKIEVLQWHRETSKIYAVETGFAT